MTKDWERHKARIEDLYKVQGKTLDDIMKTMKEEFGFHASKRAYRGMFKRWAWNKYVKKTHPPLNPLSTKHKTTSLPDGDSKTTLVANRGSVPSVKLESPFEGGQSSFTGDALACPYARHDPDLYVACRHVRLFDRESALEHIVEGPHLQNACANSSHSQQQMELIHDCLSYNQVEQIRNLPMVTNNFNKTGHPTPLHGWWFAVYSIIFPDHPPPLDPYAVDGEVIVLLQSTTEHILSDQAALLQKAIQQHTGSQHEFAASVAQQKIRLFVQGWIGLIRRLEQKQLDEKVPAPEWHEVIMSIIPHANIASETEFRPVVSTNREWQSDIGDKEATIDSGVSVRSAHRHAPQTNMSLDEHDKDLNRVAIALKYIDIHHREINRILEGRPDLRTLDFNMDDGVASDDDASESEESGGRSPVPERKALFLAQGVAGESSEEVMTRQSAIAEALSGLARFPGVFSLDNKSEQSSVAEDLGVNASTKEEHPSCTTDQSRTFSSLEFSDIEDTEDGDDGSSCADLSWFSPGMTMKDEYPLLSLEVPAIEELIKAYHAWTVRGERAVNNDSAAGQTHLSQTSSSRKHGKRKVDESHSNEEGEQSVPILKKGRKEVSDGQARLACHFQKRFPEHNAACGIRKRGFTTIAQIKQHFWRCHVRNPNYCPVCKSTFATEEARNEHIMQVRTNPCEESSAPLPEGLSHSLVESLTRRADKGFDITSQWFSIWDLIFPGVPRPQTCTFDLHGEIHIQALDLASYIEVEGPRIVLSFLNTQGFDVVPSGSHDLLPDVDAFLRRTLTAALQSGTQEWLSQRQARGTGGNETVAMAEPAVQIGEDNGPPTPDAITLENRHPSAFTFSTDPGGFAWGTALMGNNMPHDFGLEMDGMHDLGSTDMSQAVLGEDAPIAGSLPACMTLQKDDHVGEMPLQFGLE